MTPRGTNGTEFSIFCQQAGCPDRIPAVIAYLEKTTGSVMCVESPVRLTVEN